MQIQGARVLVLGGGGLVGSAVCRELLTRKPAEIRIDTLHPESAEAARAELVGEAGTTAISMSSGDMLGLSEAASTQDELEAQLLALQEVGAERFRLFQLLSEFRPDVVIDCVNTATAIAYRNLFRAAEQSCAELREGAPTANSSETLLGSLYIPRLVRHVQVLYEAMQRVGTQEYVKVGTTGTGGMGLNIPYTHSEERPSRMLLSKSAVAGAQSMLLFLMSRTPGAPVTKEIKPAAAIGWKQIAYGPVLRRGEPIRRVHAQPQPLGETLSTHDADAAVESDEVLQNAYIDTGENGLYALEEFATLTTAQQMEFVTPEEIAKYIVLEIEGNSSGHNVLSALEHSVLGPSYRAGLLRHWALEHLHELEQQHGVHSVAFEMLGPPRVTKLLFEAHLLRLAFGTMTAVREASAADVSQKLNELVRTQTDLADEIASIGIPLLLASGDVIRGPRIILPGDAEGERVTPEKLETWVRDGWVDLREPNCSRWLERFSAIHEETGRIPDAETSSRHLRNRRFWHEQDAIQPGKVVGWILSTEEHGERIKG